jgi:hypothetical protein
MCTIRTRDLMTITLEKAIEQYLSTLGTGGKSRRYIGWLRERLGYLTKFILKTRGENCSLRDLTVEDGMDFVCDLMEWDIKYRDHPHIKPKSDKLSIQYIHSCEAPGRGGGFPDRRSHLTVRGLQAGRGWPTSRQPSVMWKFSKMSASYVKRPGKNATGCSGTTLFSMRFKSLCDCPNKITFLFDFFGRGLRIGS